MEMKFCQSCGMPLTPEILGTNADGSKNEEYKAELRKYFPTLKRRRRNRRIQETVTGSKNSFWRCKSANFAKNGGIKCQMAV